MVGDSVTLAAAGELANSAPHAAIDGEVSRTSSKAIPLIKQTAESACTLPTVVVLGDCQFHFLGWKNLRMLTKRSADGKRRLIL